MGNYFSKKSKRRQRVLFDAGGLRKAVWFRKLDNEITEVDKAILSLKTQRRKLNSERKRLEQVLEKNVAAIRELVSRKQKDKALLALKKKKMREDQLKNLDNWLIHVEELLGTIEFSQQQNVILAALRVGADALKDIQKEVRIEDVEKLTEDTEEAKAYLEEIHEALGRDSEADVAALEDELRALEVEILEEERIDMPSVPITRVKVQEQPAAVSEKAEKQKRKAEAPLLA